MTVTEIVDEIWAHSPRTVDGQAPAAPSGGYVDDVAYAVWTYITRIVEGGTNYNIDGVGGIASQETFGLLSVVPVVAYNIDGVGGIVSAEAFGSPTITTTISLVGIPSAEAFGLLTVDSAIQTLTRGILINNQWRAITETSVFIAGTWRPVVETYVLIGGSWRLTV